jgi:hypothetical protein
MKPSQLISIMAMLLIGTVSAVPVAKDDSFVDSYEGYVSIIL